jgi:hypothetical protein
MKLHWFEEARRKLVKYWWETKLVCRPRIIKEFLLFMGSLISTPRIIKE